ncbi:MAG TPA: carboxypeptidase-like regulatory domain-containing protein [Bryobacteraceae bacterium]|nr:carboxypeptidase-like regulatory domain-containing protein [Bryobacteraceae bacterium]
MKRKRRSGTKLLLLALAFAVAAGAAKKKPVPQSYAIVAGTVFQESGYALPNAEITLTPAPQPQPPAAILKPLQALSDSRGEFVFRIPPVPMHYTVKAALKGYQPAEKPIVVEGEQRVDVTFQLQAESKQ